MKHDAISRKNYLSVLKGERHDEKLLETINTGTTDPGCRYV